MLASKASFVEKYKFDSRKFIDGSWIISLLLIAYTVFLSFMGLAIEVVPILLLIVVHQVLYQLFRYINSKNKFFENYYLPSALHLIFISFFVFYSGGFSSPFTFLYLLLIGYLALNYKVKEIVTSTILIAVFFALSSVASSIYFPKAQNWVISVASLAVSSIVVLAGLSIRLLMEINRASERQVLLKNSLGEREQELIYLDELLDRLKGHKRMDDFICVFNQRLVNLISCKEILFFTKNEMNSDFTCKSALGHKVEKLKDIQIKSETEPILDEISNSKEAMILDGKEAGALMPDLSTKIDVENALVVPMVRGEEVEAIICCLNKDKSFSANDLRLVTIASRQILTLVENAMLGDQISTITSNVDNSKNWLKKSRKAFVNILEDINDANDRLEKALHQTLSMYKIAVELSKSLDEKTLLKTILSNSADLAQAKSGSLILTKGSNLDQATNYNFKGDLILSCKNPLEWIKSEMKPIVINDFSKTMYKKYQLHTGIKNLLGVPLVQGKRCLGVLCLFEKTGGFSLQDRQNLVTLARQATITILNARIHENERKTINKLKEIDKMKADFIASVSHELRSPLTTIKGYLDLVIEGEAGAINSEQLEFLNIADKSTERLYLLISDLLTVAKIESASLKIKKQEILLNSVIEGVVKQLGPEAKQKGLKIKLNLSKSIPQIMADPKRLEQVVINLLNNAIKFTPKGGAIELFSKFEANSVLVGVKDSGPGISAKDQRRLFDKFYRAQDAVVRNIKGTGLGLAIAKGVIEQHKGNIWVESEVKKGSTFFFSLPIENKRVA